MYSNYTSTGWSNSTVISDDYTHWNTGSSKEPSIAIDNNDTIHVVWQDDTGYWGGDTEILYVSNTGSGWSNVSCISDVYGWNDGSSDKPEIAIDINGTVHVVWEDTSNGEWGGGPSDRETMYTSSFTPTLGEPSDSEPFIPLIIPETDSLPLILTLVLVGTAVGVIIVIIYVKKK
jgi:hypothetical protein